MNGQMAESTKVSGRTIKWRAMVYSHGLMAEDMKETTSMTRKKAKAFSIGKLFSHYFISSI